MKHGLYAYQVKRCRCDVCRRANSEAHYRWALKAVDDIPEHVHGTLNGYGNYSCRCDRCVAKKSEYHAAYWQQRKLKRQVA